MTVQFTLLPNPVFPLERASTPASQRGNWERFLCNFESSLCKNGYFGFMAAHSSQYGVRRTACDCLLLQLFLHNSGAFAVLPVAAQKPILKFIATARVTYIDETVVMVLYHGTDSSSKHRKVNLHNLSIRWKASGLREDSGDRYFAAGIDRTLNGGLTQCANSGNIFHSWPHYPVAHLFQRHSQETGALCRGLE